MIQGFVYNVGDEWYRLIESTSMNGREERVRTGGEECRRRGRKKA